MVYLLLDDKGLPAYTTCKDLPTDLCSQIHKYKMMENVIFK